MARWRVAVLIGLVFLAGCGAALKGPQPRELWHAIVYEGQRCGYEHVTVARLPDGNFRYAVDTRLLISLLGARQEITRRAEYVVTPSFRPVSVKVEGKQLSGDVAAEGRARGDRLVVTFTRAGHELTRSLDVSGDAIFAACLGEWLRDLPRETEAASAKLIEDETWAVMPAEARRIVRNRSCAVWDVDLGDLGTETIRCDARGLALERESRLTKMRVRRCTPAEARDIDYLKGEGRFVLMFPLGRPLPAPHRLTELTVKLTWKDIGFDQFELTDARQQVVETSRKGRAYEALVKLRPQPPAGPDLKTAYPIRGEQFAPYLAETLFVKPHDLAIRAAARQIVSGKTTALEAARALSAWVFKNVKPALIAETLTGPEVLRCKRGECAEYTTLFASLARSVGIPTRIALGVRMAGSHWVGHLWNEVYVGRWIPVDAAANEVGGSCALLKFIHSDRVLGTLRVRFGLTGSLDIAIEDFRARPAALAGDYKTGVEGRIYTNADYACRLTAPADGWKIEPRPGGGATVVRFRIPEAEKVNVHFVAFPLPAGAGPKMLIDARLDFVKLRLKDFQLLENEPCKVKGAAGHTSRFRWASGKDGKKRSLTTEVLWTRGSFGYLLNLIAEESAHDKHLPDFNRLLAGFEFLQAK